MVCDSVNIKALLYCVVTGYIECGSENHNTKKKGDIIMNELVYPREHTLGVLTLVLGLLAWLGLIAGTFGAALVGLAAGFIVYLFIQSTLISYIKGNGVELSESQFPDLYKQFSECCNRLQITKPPKAYVLNGNGGLNAFATKFLGTQYVVLMSDVVDAMSNHTDGTRFYIGHELGHLRMKHLNIGHLIRWPVMWLPLLGAAYSRARESTCDRHGLACSSTPEGAARALGALSAGSERWKDLDIKAYLNQAKHSKGFWMSFHELTAGYPWLTKRAARVMDTKASMPKRNPFAYLLALFVPFAGRMGGGFGFLVMIYVVAMLAAVAIPQYKNYSVKANLATVVSETESVRDSLTNYYISEKNVPESLAALGTISQLADGTELSLNPDNMILTASTKNGELIFTPKIDDNGNIFWECTGGEGLNLRQIPKSCLLMGQ
jgi:Zn-dependent protease with chaperone function/Tfp pilus assembly protein PilE